MTNSDTTNFEVNDLIHSAIKKSFKTSAFKASSTSLRAKAFYKPGGTMSLVHNDLVGRVVDRGGDDTSELHRGHLSEVHGS